MTAVLFRKERFEKLAVGHFWLSENSDVPGSKSWDTRCRMVTWLKSRILRQHPIGDLLLQHPFRSRGQLARQESARLNPQEDRRTRGGVATPTVVTGDFNAGGGEPRLSGSVH